MIAASDFWLANIKINAENFLLGREGKTSVKLVVMHLQKTGKERLYLSEINREIESRGRHPANLLELLAFNAKSRTCRKVAIAAIGSGTAGKDECLSYPYIAGCPCKRMLDLISEHELSGFDFLTVCK